MLGAGETFTILTPDTTTNRYGRTTTDPDWSGATETAVVGLFAPQSSLEDNDGRSAVTSEARLYLPAGTAITAACRVEVRGDTYEVIGDPAVWSDPFGGSVEGVDVQVRKVVG